MASRFSLPLAVNNPLSMENAVALQMERANLFVVRKVEIHGIKSRLNGIFRRRPHTMAERYHGRCPRSALEAPRNLLQQFVLNRLGWHVVAGTQDNRFFKRPATASSRGIHFA